VQFFFNFFAVYMPSFTLQLIASIYSAYVSSLCLCFCCLQCAWHRVLWRENVHDHCFTFYCCACILRQGNSQ